MEYLKNETADRKRFLTVRELAYQLCVSPQTIYNRLSDSSFPIKAKRIGRLVRFDIRDVEKYIETL